MGEVILLIFLAVLVGSMILCFLLMAIAAWRLVKEAGQ